MTTRSLPPEQVLADVQAGRVRLLDLRTWPERRLLGSPPGAQPVSLLRHGAAEVAGGFRAWRERELPTVGA
jgi:hypothetical protein